MDYFRSLSDYFLIQMYETFSANYTSPSRAVPAWLAMPPNALMSFVARSTDAVFSASRSSGQS
ncbi:hypothetical protein [Bradyrhizobium sp. F1.13.3]|uniref:hypothetical protein n=1 Tax=Bradyrhizobium sp. F1.13.3 TaxID=3156351 RepID=UPI0033977A64